MSEYFKDFIQSLHEKSVSEIDKELKRANASASAKGMLLSGAQWKVREQIFLDSVAGFGDGLVRSLVEHSSIHGPIKSSDFSLARSALEDFRKSCEDKYRLLREDPRWGYPKNHKPFYGTKMDFVVSEYEHKISGFESTFKSERSFLKWAFGDLMRKIWSGFLLATRTVIGVLFEPLIKSDVPLVS